MLERSWVIRAVGLFVAAAFVLCAATDPTDALAATHTSSGVAMLVPAGAPSLTFGAANPYPSTITVSGEQSHLAKVKVTLNSVTHANPDDIDVLLESPSGAHSILMSDACGGSAPALSTDSITFGLTAAQNVPDTACGTPTPSEALAYFPKDYESSTDAFISGSFTADLRNFWDSNPNGTWKLYVGDDTVANTGSIASWTLDIESAEIVDSADGTGVGPGDPYPLIKPVGGLNGVVSDVNVSLVGFTHPYPTDVRVLVQSPTGRAAVVLGHACTNIPLVDAELVLDDEAAATPPFLAACATGAYTPVNYGGDEPLPAPAPGPPYLSALSTFDGDQPNGDWKVFVWDALAPDAGWIKHVNLDITTAPAAVAPSPPVPPAPTYKTVKKCKKVKVKSHGRVVRTRSGKIKYKKKCSKKRVAA